MKDMILAVDWLNFTVSLLIILSYIAVHTWLGKKLQRGEYKSVWSYRFSYLVYTMMSLVLVFAVFLVVLKFYTWLFTPVHTVWQVLGLFLAVVFSAVDLHLMMKKVSWSQVDE